MSMTLELVAQRVEILEKQMAALMADKTTEARLVSIAAPRTEAVSAFIVYSSVAVSCYYRHA